MNRKITFAKAIQEALEEELSLDPRIIILGEDILDTDTRQVVTSSLKERFPERVFNHLPLVEDMLGGIALGMSLKGSRPIVQLDYSTFITLALNDIHRIGSWRYRMFEKSGPGIIFRIGYDGYSRKGSELATSLLGTIFHLPNMRIITPSLPYYAKGLLKTAIRSGEPTVFFEYKKLYEKTNGPEVPSEDYTLPLGNSPIFRNGKDITFIAWGYAGFLAMQAAQVLSGHKIQTEVISPQTLHPIDMDPIFCSAKKTRRVIVVEEDMLRGGIGAELCARIIEKIPGCQIRRVAAKNIPLPYAKNIEKILLPNVQQIISAAKELLRQRPWWRLW